MDSKSEEKTVHFKLFMECEREADQHKFERNPEIIRGSVFWVLPE